MVSRKTPPYSALLKTLRKKHRYSVRELEDATGVSRSYITMLERGYDKRTQKTIRPSREILTRLGEALGSSEDALLLAAGYVPEEVAASVAEEEHRPPTRREPLSPDVVDELKEKMTDAMMEVLRKRGYIK